MQHYNGFDIDDRHRIYYNGKKMTGEFWTCYSLDQAKHIIDISNLAHAEQIRRQEEARLSYSIVKPAYDYTDEAKEMEAASFEDKLNAHYERENWEGGV